MVCGWAQRQRDLGQLIFIDLRDRTGIIQLAFDDHTDKEIFGKAFGVRAEFVLAAKGVVRERSSKNKEIPTGEVEIEVTDLRVLSKSETPPFEITEDSKVKEELRLKYRYLDLRRPDVQDKIIARHKIVKIARDYFDQNGFVEVETPILIKSTPEGARDYLVPSRVFPGSFFALPQSPQLYKQLTMLAGFDRYMQIARCFRDEDLRADRQPEFTQVDMEMSFVDQEDILEHLERLFKHIFRQMRGREIEGPFPRMTWQEAMDRYGSDKPDLRFDLPIVDLTDIARSCGFSVFRKVADASGVVRAINVKGCADFTRTQIEDLTRKAQSYGAGGMAWIARKPDGSLYSILTKYFTKEEMDAILARVDAKPGDFILFGAGTLAKVRDTLGRLRLDLGEMLGLRRKDDFRFLMVTDFPQFEYSEEEGRFVATHHPFTMPYPEDVPYLLTDPGRVRAQAYDVVLNGVELGSGSIRIHDDQIQQKMFEALGFTDEEIENRFGFMVHAFQYGTPPHGGFAFGLDRLAMLLLGEDSLRQVIAFPKVKDASCPLTGAPGMVDDEQLEALHLGVGEARRRRADKGVGGSRRKTVDIDVDNVADLSKLTLSPEEKKTMKQELSAIIAFADQLSALDTEGVEPTAHVLPMKNVFREDVVVPSFDRDSLLQNTPTAQDGYIYVPKVVEE